MWEIKGIKTGVNSYLQILNDFANMPSTLYVLGSLPSERRTSVAIVGTRRPSSYGKQVTYDLAYKLAKEGIIIVSGLAFGIDAIAHKAALDAGGITIAVQANGLDSLYPASHRQLAKQIVESGGAIISEYPVGTPAHKHHFLARNRLVSGLSDAIVVTEAATRSGTLSTVNHALDQNKEVFAVPGNITSLLSIGPNALIQQGAHPVLSVENILEIVAPDHIPEQTTLLGSTPLEQKILEFIQAGIQDNEELQQESAVGASEFSQAMTMLEIQGRIRPTGGSRWSLL